MPPNSRCTFVGWSISICAAFCSSSVIFSNSFVSVILGTMTKPSSDCASCGQADNLKSCSVCEQRLKQKGTANALCETCLSNEQSLNFFGIVIKKDDTTEYRCRPCVAFLSAVLVLYHCLVSLFGVPALCPCLVSLSCVLV